MLDRPLTMALGNYGLTAPLKAGAIDLGRLRLQHVEIEPITAAMRRMVRGLEFDICEMAVTTYLCARAYGKPVTAIPVFVSRNFHHWAAFTHSRAGIKTPKDLEGRRVAVNRGYTVTTGVWMRGILHSQYGVDLSRITWVPTDDEHVAEFEYPGSVDLSCRGQSASDLLVSGNCDAAIGDGRTPSPEIKPLIPEARAAGFQCFRDTGIYPVNHLITIKSATLDAHPWLARELYAAFVRSRDQYYARLRSGADLSPADAGAAEIQRELGIEPFPFGLEANRKALETIAAFALDQKILRAPMALSELFAVVEG
jgi:4,5-dihydroxyphthalate decarboxylase